MTSNSFKSVVYEYQKEREKEKEEESVCVCVCVREREREREKERERGTERQADRQTDNKTFRNKRKIPALITNNSPKFMMYERQNFLRVPTAGQLRQI